MSLFDKGSAVMRARLAPLLVAFSAAGCGRGASLPPVDPSRPAIRLTSTAFAEGGMIPKTYTCDGEGKSPPLAWADVPSSARTLVLLCDDPDAPGGNFSHWVVFNIPRSVTSLDEGLAKTKTVTTAPGVALVHGLNDFGVVGYGGPCPPFGTHRYFFRLYAVDGRLDLAPGASRDTVLETIEEHIVAEGRLMGKYARSESS
jgi:Raf kinase inhibitor-like YbhB/YbcL family protein